MTQFTKEYFIEKFSAIPDQCWIIGELTDENNPNCHCALGHCGVSLTNDSNYVMTEESEALGSIFEYLYPSKLDYQRVYNVNDFYNPSLGKTPKERILTALRRAK